MFERYTEAARLVVIAAQEEARLLRNDYLGSEHLLLGLLREDAGIAAQALHNLRVTAEIVRERAVQLIGAGDAEGGGKQIPFTPRSKLILEKALRVGLSMGVNYVGPEHVLLALVEEDEGVGVRILNDLDVDRTALERELDRLRSAGPRDPPDLPRVEQVNVDDGERAAPQPADGRPDAVAGIEPIPTHADQPAVGDALGRARLAEVLAERMRRVRGENTQQPVGSGRERRAKLRRDRAASSRAGSFTIHIHAPWGAGKSSLLNFLAAELRNVRERRDTGTLRARLVTALRAQPPRDPSASQWIVVQFSAWEHQRLAPPWWWLLAAIRRSCTRELWRIDHSRWAWFRVRDLAWRLWNARAVWITALLAGGLVLLARELDWLGLQDRSLDALRATAVAVAALIALGTIGWGWIRGTSRWLAFGSADGAARFLRRAHDPLGVYRRRLRWLVRSAGRPIAVFIDDLDRCRPDYVVELLEGLQTLFAAEPVTYVVAADRMWLCESFASTYKTFGDVVGEPGRPIGFLFLEKTFQVSMEILPMSPAVRREYWRTLMASERAAKPVIGAEPLDLSHAFDDVRSQADVEARIDALAGAGVAVDDARRAGVRALNAPELQAQVERLLSEFAPLVENNPRSMKRLLNAYGIERDRLVRDGHALGIEERKQLVLLTILRLRWPLLADHLLRHPDDAVLFAGGTESQNGHPFAAHIGDRDVRALFDGSRVPLRIDREVLQRYTGNDADALRPPWVPRPAR